MSTTFIAPDRAQRMARRHRTNVLLATLTRLWAAYDHWRNEHAAVAALQALSDRELKDIGLSRGEIVHAARGEAVGGRADSRNRRAIWAGKRLP
jgi:uncharacterized protein YjiS (DUF1127 family)